MTELQAHSGGVYANSCGPAGTHITVHCMHVACEPDGGKIGHVLVLSDSYCCKQVEQCPHQVLVYACCYQCTSGQLKWVFYWPLITTSAHQHPAPALWPHCQATIRPLSCSACLYRVTLPQQGECDRQGNLLPPDPFSEAGPHVHHHHVPHPAAHICSRVHRCLRL